MATLWRRAMVYLGLQDDEEGYEYDYEGYDDYEGDDGHGHGHAPEPVPAGQGGGRERERERERRPVDAFPSVRPLPAERGGSDEVSVVAQSPAIRTVPATSARVHVVDPRGFNDAQEVGDRLKANQPVILNLQGLGRDLQRRLIDFSSGLAYAVGGSMARVADQVFLLTPSDVEVSQEEKERLQARGLYRT
jgi:cell division inhibitor SepF